MSIDKKINYVEQDGYNNYIKNSDSVTVPRKFKSREDATPTKLAYITADEAKMLKKMKKGTPHKGPSGVPSYDSFDAQGNYTSGTAMSAAETGSTNKRDRAEVRASNIGGPKGLAPGVKSQEELALRAATINAGAGQRVNPGFFDSRNTVSPAELAMAKAYRKDPNNLFANQAYKKTRGGGLGSFISGGGLLGNIVRGIGQRFGLGKRYNEPTYNISNLNNKSTNIIDKINNFQGDFREKYTGYRTQQDYDDARQNRINLQSIDRIQNTLNRKYPDGDYSNTNLDERLADLKQSMGIGDVATVNQINDRPTQTFSFDNSGMTRSDLNNIESLVAASQVPQDLNQIGKGAGYVGYDKNELAAIAAGTKTPQLGDLTSFIDPLATITARERELKNYFDSPIQPQEGIMGIDVEYPGNDLMAFNPGSKRDKTLKMLDNQFQEGLFMNDANKSQYEQLLQEDLDSGEPLSLPQNAYSLIG